MVSRLFGCWRAAWEVAAFCGWLARRSLLSSGGNCWHWICRGRDWWPCAAADPFLWWYPALGASCHRSFCFQQSSDSLGFWLPWDSSPSASGKCPTAYNLVSWKHIHGSFLQLERGHFAKLHVLNWSLAGCDKLLSTITCFWAAAKWRGCATWRRAAEMLCKVSAILPRACGVSIWAAGGDCEFSSAVGGNLHNGCGSCLLLLLCLPSAKCVFFFGERFCSACYPGWDHCTELEHWALYVSLHKVCASWPLLNCARFRVWIDLRIHTILGNPILLLRFRFLAFTVDCHRDLFRAVEAFFLCTVLSLPQILAWQDAAFSKKWPINIQHGTHECGAVRQGC